MRLVVAMLDMEAADGASDQGANPGRSAKPAAARRPFEAKLAQQRDFAAREQAALATLSAKKD